MTQNKLMKKSGKHNQKQLQVQHETIQEELLYSDTEESNQKRTGLPSIRKFYQKYKEADKRVQLGQDLRQPQVAFIKEAQNYQMIPIPYG